MIKKFFFVFVSTISCLLFIEYLLRTPFLSLEIPKSPWLYNYWVWDDQDAQTEACSQLDEELIYSLKANNESNPKCPVTNDFGFRVSPGLNTGNKTDILFIGDSFTLSEGVQAYEAFPFYVGTILNSEKYSVNIHNAGMMGYSTDQSVIQLEKTIKKGLVPDIVILSIYENDFIADNNEACLFKLSDNSLKKVSGRFNTMYLTAWLIERAPFRLKKSRLFWFFLSAIPHRYTIGCTTSAEYYEKIKLKKLKLLVEKVEKLSKEENFELIVSYIVGKDYFKKDPSSNYVSELKEIEIALNESTKNVVILHEKLFDSETSLNEVTIDSSETAKILGYSIEEKPFSNFSIPVDRIFIPDDVHFNKEGNYLEAKIIADKIKELKNM
jgi:lysophospholipase L1-like esterase